jgi:hypothetical protein
MLQGYYMYPVHGTVTPAAVAPAATVLSLVRQPSPLPERITDPETQAAIINRQIETLQRQTATLAKQVQKGGQ